MLSEGNPYIPHSLNFIGFPMIWTMLNASLDGISNSLHLATHNVLNYNLISLGNGPQ